MRMATRCTKAKQMEELNSIQFVVIMVRLERSFERENPHFMFMCLKGFLKSTSSSDIMCLFATRHNKEHFEARPGKWWRCGDLNFNKNQAWLNAIYLG